MARIGITGAAGNIGRELLDGFEREHEVVPFTHTEQDDIDSTLLDVTDATAVNETLVDLDVLIHLAGASSPYADWDTVAETNIHGTKHVLDAAVANDIDRVVFASSNHVVGRYNAADDDPETMTLGDTHVLSPAASIRPDSFYGVSKVACEGLTNYYADVHDLEVVNLRIGWYMRPEELRETAADDVDPTVRRFARALWLSPRDCRDLHRKAATEELAETPVTVNVVSRNDDRVHSIIEAMRILGYTPRDNSAEVLDR